MDLNELNSDLRLKPGEIVHYIDFKYGNPAIRSQI